MLCWHLSLNLGHLHCKQPIFPSFPSSKAIKSATLDIRTCFHRCLPMNPFISGSSSVFYSNLVATLSLHLSTSQVILVFRIFAENDFFGMNAEILVFCGNLEIRLSAQWPLEEDRRRLSLKVRRKGDRDESGSLQMWRQDWRLGVRTWIGI